MAGAVCPVEVMKRCINDMNMSEVSIAYGMTETSPVSCQTRADDDLDRRTASIGRVHPHVEIKIVDPETGDTVERGEPGEFCTRGYSVMLGYWNDPDKTVEAIDAARWMHTGALAVMDEEGYVTITGRIKDRLIRGGENVYPREIEEFLYTHPDVLDVQVIGTLRMAPFLSRTVAVNRSVSPGLRKAAVGLIWSVFSVTTIVAVPRCAADGYNDVAHISTFPCERPVTSPVADTVATAGLLVSHVTVPGGATGVICNVLPTPTWLVDG
jgi:hypothetical protein